MIPRKLGDKNRKIIRMSSRKLVETIIAKPFEITTVTHKILKSYSTFT